MTDHRQRLQLPGVITPPGNRCFTITIPDSPDYYGALLWALGKLAKQSTYERNETHDALTVARNWQNSIDNLLDLTDSGYPCSPLPEDEETCADYVTRSTFIGYAPNDPFISPLYTPPGYLLPPWYNNPLIPLPGVKPGDAMVNGLSIPVFASLPDILSQGFPRTRIYFSGIGRVEMELVRVPQGGFALITLDDDITSADAYDLSSINIGDIEQLEALLGVILDIDTASTTTAIMGVETPGDHHIDITFLPNVGEDIIVGFGGGLRKVTICGDITVTDDGGCPTDTGGTEMIRQDPENPCTIQQSTDGGDTWTDIIDLRLCAPIITKDQAGNTVVGYHTTEGFGYYHVPEGPWVDDPPEEAFPTNPANPVDLFRPTYSMLTQNNSKCVAAANAANVLKQLYNRSGTDLIGNINLLNFAVGNSIAIAIASLIGSGIIIAVSSLIVGQLVAFQLLYGLNTFTEADLRNLICILYAHMTGTDGAWTFDYDTIRTTLRANGSKELNYVDILLQVIGQNGLNLAGKTNAITSYTCTGLTDIWLDQTLQSEWYAYNNLKTQMWGGTVTKGQYMLMRYRILSTAATFTNGLGSDNTVAITVGYTEISKPGSGYLSPATPELWAYNQTVFTTQAAAIAAIRQVMGNPTYNVVLAGGHVTNIPAGIKPEIRWNNLVSAAAGYTLVRADLYVGNTYGTC